MVCLRKSEECSQGNHEKCSGGQSPPYGEFGGWKCTCSCHTRRLADEEMDRQLRAVGIDPAKLSIPKVSRLKKVKPDKNKGKK